MKETLCFTCNRFFPAELESKNRRRSDRKRCPGCIEALARRIERDKKKKEGKAKKRHSLRSLRVFDELTIAIYGKR